MDMQGRRFIVTVTVEEQLAEGADNATAIFVHRSFPGGDVTYRATESGIAHMAGKLAIAGLRDTLAAAGQWPPEGER